MTSFRGFSLRFLIIALLGSTLAILGGHVLPGRIGIPPIQKNQEQSIVPVFQEYIPGMLHVESQPPGQTVLISSALFDVSGWVVFHSTPEPTKTTVLGAGFFPGLPGEEQSGGAMVREHTHDGRTYYASMFRDDGDNSFDIESDTLIRMSDGKPTTVSFVIDTMAPRPDAPR